MRRKHTVVIVIVSLLVYACSKEMQGGFLSFQKPPGFPEPVYHFTTNEITKERFELGRKLFYDPILSRNNTISCGSCHIQTSAFTQHGHTVSHGVDDRLGKRNSPPIMNLAWNTTFMWDGGVFDLDLQPIVPITSHEEMDESMANILTKLNGSTTYKSLFANAFGSEEINSASTMKALSQFMLLCVSANSKYDSVVRKQGKTFTTEEQAGYAIFQQKCSSCHAEPLFTDHSFRDNGIGPGSRNDEGRYAITLNEADRFRFRVPSLRNLGYTAPFMHDGRFLTLDAVLDHYSSGVQATANLDPLLKQGSQLGIALSPEEKVQLKAFLNTLNDREFVSNKLLSEQ